MKKKLLNLKRILILLLIFASSVLFVHHAKATLPCIMLGVYPSDILKNAGLSEKLSTFKKISDTNGCSGQSDTEYQIPDNYSTIGLKYKLDFTYWSYDEILGIYEVKTLEKSELPEILDNLQDSIKNIEGNKDIKSLIDMLDVSEGYIGIDRGGNYVDFTGKDGKDTFRVDLLTGKILRIYIYSTEQAQDIVKIFPYINTIQQGDTFKKLSNGQTPSIPFVYAYEASEGFLKIRFEYKDSELWFMLQGSSSKIISFDRKDNALSNSKIYNLDETYSSYIYQVIKGEITPIISPVEKTKKVFVWWNPFTWFGR